MNKLRFGLLTATLAVVAVLAGCTNQAPTGNTNSDNIQPSTTKPISVSDSSNSFTLTGDLPTGWTENKNADSRALDMFFSPTSSPADFPENINVMRFAYATGEADMTLDKYVDSAMLGTDQSPDYKLISRTPTTVAGYPAIMVTYQASNSRTGLMQFSQTLFKAKDAGYMFTFVGTPDGAKQYQQAYEDFLKSVKLN